MHSQIAVGADGLKISRKPSEASRISGHERSTMVNTNAIMSRLSFLRSDVNVTREGTVFH